MQSGVANANTQFNRFVEGDSSTHPPTSGRRNAEPERKDFWESFGAAPKGPAKGKQDFWDEFAGAGASAPAGMERKKPSGIGTSAVKKSGGGAGGMGGKKDDEWGEW